MADSFIESTTHRILHASKLLLARAPETHEDVKKTHYISGASRPYKPLLWNMHVHKTRVVTSDGVHGLYRLPTTNINNHAVYGGYFIFYSDCEPQPTTLVLQSNGNAMDELHDYDLRAWGYKFRRAHTGAYILDNPFFNKSPGASIPSSMWGGIEIQITCPNVRKISYVYHIMNMDQFAYTQTLSIVRIHRRLNFSDVWMHNVPRQITIQKFPVEQLMCIMSPSDLAAIQSVTLRVESLVIYDDAPIDTLVTPCGAIHIDLRLPYDANRDPHQHTGYIYGTYIKLSFKLKNKDSIHMRIICRCINFLLCSDDAAVLRYSF
jgi:hypothetical protein